MANQPENAGWTAGEPPGVSNIQDLRRLAGCWVDSYHVEIYRFLARMSKDASTAEDLTQETFLQAFRSCQQLRKPGSARAWLYRIAWNTYLSHLKSARKDIPEAADGAAEIGEIEDGRPDAEGVLLGREVRLRLSRIVERLSLQQRGAFILRIGHQLSFADMARCMGCSPAAARSHFRHALQKLRSKCRREGLHS